MKLSTCKIVLALLTQATVRAHVQLIYPPPRNDRDGQYSTDLQGPNVCHGQQGREDNYGCDSFCGVPMDTPGAPVTEVPVGSDITFQWKVNIPHYNRQGVFRYRLAFNGQGDGDAHFDDPDNLIGWATYPDNYDVESGQFSFVGQIPESFLDNCNNPESPCALHLFDDYFFVSCANVVLVGSGGGRLEGNGLPATDSGVDLGETGGEDNAGTETLDDETLTVTAPDDTANGGQSNGNDNSNGNDSGNSGNAGGNAAGETPVPTPAATTLAPVTSPTNPPTKAPTKAPSKAPTKAPSTAGPTTMAPTRIDKFPHQLEFEGSIIPFSVKLADGTGEPNNRGFCPDIRGGHNGTGLNCQQVHGGSCKPVGTETSFGYKDTNLTIPPVIYATHYGGGQGGRRYDASECRPLPTRYDTPGCLTAIAGNHNRPQDPNGIMLGGSVGLYKCANLEAQRFYYTNTGKFQIGRGNTIFCLGMARDSELQPNGLVERSLELMRCNADAALITWEVTPRPRYVVLDGTFDLYEGDSTMPTGEDEIPVEEEGDTTTEDETDTSAGDATDTNTVDANDTTDTSGAGDDTDTSTTNEASSAWTVTFRDGDFRYLRRA